MDIKLLEEMAGRSIGETPPEDLKDILQVDIRGDTVCQKWEDYLARIGNPYCFRVGETPVRISFKPEGKALEENLKTYVRGGQRAGDQESGRRRTPGA